tara:strand:- start:814 stop:1392 length:579 start_codon:yes stop_codon:yes gene_type:complete
MESWRNFLAETPKKPIDLQQITKACDIIKKDHIESCKRSVVSASKQTHTSNKCGPIDKIASTVIDQSFNTSGGTMFKILSSIGFDELNRLIKEYRQKEDDLYVAIASHGAIAFSEVWLESNYKNLDIGINIVNEGPNRGIYINTTIKNFKPCEATDHWIDGGGIRRIDNFFSGRKPFADNLEVELYTIVTSR